MFKISYTEHVQLYKAFGWQAPEFIHMPLLRNADKSKISKRKNPVSLYFYERAGFLPEAMLNYLALMGWTLPDQREKFPIKDMIEHFSFDRISLGGPVFDLTMEVLDKEVCRTRLRDAIGVLAAVKPS